MHITFCSTFSFIFTTRSAIGKNRARVQGLFFSFCSRGSGVRVAQYLLTTWNMESIKMTSAVLCCLPGSHVDGWYPITQQVLSLFGTASVTRAFESTVAAGCCFCCSCKAKFADNAVISFVFFFSCFYLPLHRKATHDSLSDSDRLLPALTLRPGLVQIGRSIVVSPAVVSSIRRISI